MRRPRMNYAGSCELIAEMILKTHKCGPDCICWEIRRLPRISDWIRKLHVEKLQAAKSG